MKIEDIRLEPGQYMEFPDNATLRQWWRKNSSTLGLNPNYHIHVFEEVLYLSPGGTWGTVGYPHPNMVKIFFPIISPHSISTGCECGAHHTSFPNHHLSYCPMGGKSA